MELYGGFEGGGSSGLVVLLDSQGKVVAEEKCDKSTNFLQTGFEECGNIIVDLTNKAKAKCGLSPDTPLKSMGLTLSGADSKDDCAAFKKHLLDKSPSLGRHLEVCCDTDGSIATVSPEGGIVLIAGTGSSCLLSNPGGDTHRCGGWGHMLGDEGSGYWISMKCLKTYFDHVDNLVPCQHDVTAVRNVIFEYFNVTDRFGMLDPLYTTFSKKFFAGLSEKLAKEQCLSRDPLITQIFLQTGEELANHIVALLPLVHESLLRDGLDILCIGSVWKSWPLLQPGFVSVLSKAAAIHKDTNAALEGDVVNKGVLKKIRLLNILKDSTLGAAYIGAKCIGVELDIRPKDNYQVFYEQEF